MGNNCPAGDTTVLRSTPEYVNRISAQISGISIPDHATPGTNNYARGRAGLSPHFCRIEQRGRRIRVRSFQSGRDGFYKSFSTRSVHGNYAE